MIRILPLAVLFLMLGCSQTDQASAPLSNSAAEAPVPTVKASVASLAGGWRVTAVTGVPTAGSMGVAFVGGRATASAGCLRRAWTYRQDRNTVGFTSAPGGSSNCGRSPSAEEEATFGAIGDANLAIFGKDGGDVTLSGTGGTLTLERR